MRQTCCGGVSNAAQQCHDCPYTAPVQRFFPLPPGFTSFTAVGWHCPNCGRAHAPDVKTCPEPVRDGSLRDRVRAAA